MRHCEPSKIRNRESCQREFRFSKTERRDREEVWYGVGREGYRERPGGISESSEVILEKLGDSLLRFIDSFQERPTCGSELMRTLSKLDLHYELFWFNALVS